MKTVKLTENDLTNIIKEIISEDSEIRFGIDDKISDDIFKQQSKKGRKPYVINPKIVDGLGKFGLTRHRFEFYPQYIFFLTPEEVKSFYEEELKVYNILVKLEKTKDSLIKFLKSTIEKKIG